MTTAKWFEDLEVWPRAKEQTNLIYRFSSSGTFAKDFGIRDQMRRASVSIMSNIAEGFESQTQVIFIQYLSRAKGSSGELRAQLYIALEQEYIMGDEFKTALALAKFIQYLESQPNARRVREDGVHYDIQH